MPALPLVTPYNVTDWPSRDIRTPGNAASTVQPGSDSTAATPQPTVSTENTGMALPNGGEAKQPPLNDPPTEVSADKPADKSAE